MGTALLSASSTEMMQDFPLHELVPVVAIEHIFDRP